MHADLPAVAEHARRHSGRRGLSLIQERRAREPRRTPRFWAQEQKREPTPGPVNYIIEARSRRRRDRRHDQGHGARAADLAVLVCALVDPRTIVLTGLTRDGLWWIEKGQIRYPVRNLRFNQSVLAMLAPGTSRWSVRRNVSGSVRGSGQRARG